MDVRELRIGNILQRADGSIFTVTAEDIILINACKNPFAPLPEPIPITEEWLFKFGFKKVNYFGEHYVDSGSDFCVWLDQKGAAIKRNNGEDCPIGDCEYVHKLQNLYFAVEGEEIEIK